MWGMGGTHTYIQYTLDALDHMPDTIRDMLEWIRWCYCIDMLGCGYNEISECGIMMALSSTKLV